MKRATIREVVGAEAEEEEVGEVIGEEGTTKMETEMRTLKVNQWRPRQLSEASSSTNL